jgi:predicted acetyltransferase
VQLIFKRFAGRWEVTESQSNHNAIAFWRSVVRECSAGKYRERLENGEVKQYFDSKQLRGTPGHHPA